MMRTRLALAVITLSSTYAIANPEGAPADPYTDKPVEKPAETPAPAPPAPAPPAPATVTQPRPLPGPLGLVVFDISPDLRKHLGAPRDRGVLIDAIQPGTFAAKAGLKVGDLVLDVNNLPITSGIALDAAAFTKKQGEQVVLDIMRTGIPATLRAPLDVEPAAPTVRPQDAETQLRQQVEDLRRRLDTMERRLEQTPPARPADGT